MNGSSTQDDDDTDFEEPIIEIEKQISALEQRDPSDRYAEEIAQLRETRDRDRKTYVTVLVADRTSGAPPIAPVPRYSDALP